MRIKINGEARGDERGAFKNAIVLVDVGNQVKLDVLPAVAQAGERGHVDGNTVPFHARHRAGIAPTQQCTAQRGRIATDSRTHGANQVGSHPHVGRAVVEYVPLLRITPRATGKNQVAHGALVVGVSGGDAEIRGRSQQAGEHLAVKGAVGNAGKFGVEVDAARRHWPAERNEAGPLGGRRIPDKKGIGAQRKRRRGEVALPCAHPAAADEVVRHQAHDLRVLTIAGDELKVQRPDGDIRQGIWRHASPSKRLTTGCPASRMMKLSPNATARMSRSGLSGQTGVPSAPGALCTS